MSPTARQICLMAATATACALVLMLAHAFVVWVRTPDPPEECREVVEILEGSDDDRECGPGRTLYIEVHEKNILAICRCPRREP